MIDNQTQRTCFFIFIFLLSTMIVLIGLLFFQYTFFCKQAEELIVLKQHYARYIDVMQKKEYGNSMGMSYQSQAIVSVESPDMTEEEFLAAESSDEPDDEDEYIDDTFVVINRESDYLKQSTVEYLQAQELDALMTKIDMNQWDNYTEQKIGAPSHVSTKLGGAILPSQRQSQVTSSKKPIDDCGFSWPIERDKFWLSSLYGPRKRVNGTWGFHHGIDMAAVKGTAVKSARSGRVVEASFQAGFGNTVVIEHTAELKTRYAHLHTIRVRVGQAVKSGVIIGTVGDTGFIRKKGKDGSHLHFEVYKKGKRVNPLHCLPRSA